LGLGNVLFGRKKLKDPVGERLFAISTARITLETELDLKPTGSAGVCFKALSAGEFVRAENEIQQLLDSVATESGSKIDRRSDELGFEWIVIRDQDFEDLVASVHLVASELEARGFGPQLLAAVFPFESKGFDAKSINWIYGFKQGTFWPFVPKGEGKDKERDNAEELELKAKLEKELPVEQDLTRWFGIFDAPV
jgi:hypothetical protein